MLTEACKPTLRSLKTSDQKAQTSNQIPWWQILFYSKNGQRTYGAGFGGSLSGGLGAGLGSGLGGKLGGKLGGSLGSTLGGKRGGGLKNRY